MERKFTELREAADKLDTYWTGWTEMAPWDPNRSWGERDRQKQAFKERANPSNILGLFKLIDDLQAQVNGTTTRVELVPSPSDVRAAALVRLKTLIELPNPPADELKALANVALSMQEMK